MCPYSLLIPVLVFPPVLGALSSPRYHIVGQASGRAREAAGHLQAPPPVYIDNVTDGMTVPGLLLRLLPYVGGTRDLFLPLFPLHSRSLPRLQSHPGSRARASLRYCPHFRPRSHPRSHILFVLPSLPLFALPPRPSPRHRPHSRPRPRSRPRLRPRPGSLLPVRRTWLPPRDNARLQTPGLTNGTVRCPQAPPPVCRGDDACGMKVPVDKQKRITAGNVPLPSPPPDAGARWNVSPTCALLI